MTVKAECYQVQRPRSLQGCVTAAGQPPKKLTLEGANPQRAGPTKICTEGLQLAVCFVKVNSTTASGRRKRDSVNQQVDISSCRELSRWSLIHEVSSSQGY